MDNPEKQEWTTQRNWQHWVRKTKDEDKQNKKHNTENEKFSNTDPQKKPGGEPKCA